MDEGIPSFPPKTLKLRYTEFLLLCSRLRKVINLLFSLYIVNMSGETEVFLHRPLNQIDLPLVTLRILTILHTHPMPIHILPPTGLPIPTSYLLPNLNTRYYLHFARCLQTGFELILSNSPFTYKYIPLDYKSRLVSARSVSC